MTEESNSSKMARIFIFKMDHSSEKYISWLSCGFIDSFSYGLVVLFWSVTCCCCYRYSGQDPWVIPPLPLLLTRILGFWPFSFLLTCFLYTFSHFNFCSFLVLNCLLQGLRSARSYSKNKRRRLKFNAFACKLLDMVSGYFKYSILNSV